MDLGRQACRRTRCSRPRQAGIIQGRTHPSPHPFPYPLRSPAARELLRIPEERRHRRADICCCSDGRTDGRWAVSSSLPSRAAAGGLRCFCLLAGYDTVGRVVA